MTKLPQDYDSVMARKNDVMNKALGIDYSVFESGSMAFDYERMMRETGYTPGRNAGNSVWCKRGKHSRSRTEEPDCTGENMCAGRKGRENLYQGRSLQSVRKL